MKKIILSIVCSFALWLIPAYPGTLKVMTFNIRYDNPGDSIFSWQSRKPMVFDVIRQEDPDVAGFQEVLHSQLMDLAKEMKEYEWFGVGRDDGKEKGEYSVIFFKKDRFEKTGGSTFWLSETPDIPGSRSWNAACNRIVTWVRLKDRKTGDTFFVFNTHFDHASEQARQESARLLLEKIRSVAGSSIAFITGDFNDTDIGIPYSILTKDKDGLADPGKKALQNSGPDYSFIGFPFKPEPGNLIDFIFTKNAEHLVIRSHAVVTYHRDNRYPSDHLPVVTTFNWPPERNK